MQIGNALPAVTDPPWELVRFALRQITMSDENYRRLIEFEVERTETLFGRGDYLLPLLRPQVRHQVALFGKGGRAVLSAIRRPNYDTLTRRPRLSKWQKGRLVLGTLAGYMTRAWQRTPNNKVNA